MACIVFSSCNATGGNSGDISTGFLSILTGEASATHADTSVWVQAQSWKDAAQQELSGTATNTNTGQSYNWNADDTSGALEARDNPDIPGAGAIDHAIVMEDLFDQPNDDLDYNDNYFNVTVDRLSLNSMTATDAANTDNAVETFGMKAPNDLYVIENDTGSTEVNLAATLLPADAAPEANWHALWELKRAGTVVESGTFDVTSVALPTTPTQGDFELVAGIDTNGDNVLQTESIGNEVTHKITIHAVKIEVRINGTDATNDDGVRQKATTASAATSRRAIRACWGK